MDYLLLVVGFVLLLKGADFFVEGSSSIAKRLRVPSLIIGLTIVAMGTSLPECAVSISAAIAGNTGVAVGNAVGSNIFNLMVVCGVCALFCPLTVSRGTLTGEFPFSVIVAAVLMVLGWLGMTLGHIDGFILLVMFAGFLLWMIRSAQKARNESEAEDLAVYCIHCRWSGCYCSRWTDCSKCCFCDCNFLWNESESDRSDHCGLWNKSAGACNLCRGCQKA